MKRLALISIGLFLAHACSSAPSRNTGNTGGEEDTSGGTGGGKTGGSGGSKTGGSSGGGSSGSTGGSAGNTGGSAGGGSGDGGSGPAADAGVDASVTKDSGSAGSGGSVAAALHDQVITVACPGNPTGTPMECSFPVAQHKFDKPFTLGGDPAVTYKVTLRFCAVFEGMRYAGCMMDNAATPKVCLGGTRSNGGNDADYPNLGLKIGDPARTYYLNREQSFLDKVFKFDYSATFEMKGGTTVNFFSDGGGNAGHYTAYGSGGPHTCMPMPPGIMKQPFLGQFLHIQVMGTEPM
jgi:hypothetical protein